MGYAYVRWVMLEAAQVSRYRRVVAIVVQLACSLTSFLFETQ